MTVFRKVDAEGAAPPKTSARSRISDPGPHAPDDGSPAPVPYIPPADKARAEESLFYFLRSLSEESPRVRAPLVMESGPLHELYAAPHPDLVEAQYRCLNGFLIELSPDTAQWGQFELSPSIWGFTLAIYNALTPASAHEGEAPDPVAEFTHALLDTLTPTRGIHEILARHALLSRPAEALPHLAASRAELMERLIQLSPLTGIWLPHHHTPPVLIPLAAEMLPGWKQREADPAPWSGLDDWLDALAPLIDHPAVASFLRRRWLSLPETRSACRNLGLLLEALRRRGGRRDFILEYYEAYDYAGGKPMKDSLRRKDRRWPILDRCAQLLRAGGDGEKTLEASLRLNRLGREYFFKFHPLIQLIAENGGRVPTEYNLLSPGWIPALRALMNYIDENPCIDIDPKTIEFISASDDEKR